MKFSLECGGSCSALYFNNLKAHFVAFLVGGLMEALLFGYNFPSVGLLFMGFLAYMWTQMYMGINQGEFPDTEKSTFLLAWAVHLFPPTYYMLYVLPSVSVSILVTGSFHFFLRDGLGYVPLFLSLK